MITELKYLASSNQMILGDFSTLNQILPGGIALIVLMSSCDCRQMVRGTVIDNDTNNPIDSAYIYKKNKYEDTSFSKENGTFELRSISGGLFGCPPMVVVVSKEGYETQTVKIQHAGLATIKLKRKNN